MNKTQLSNERLIEIVKENFPKEKEIEAEIHNSIKFYDNAVNTLGSVSQNDVGLSLFLDSISSNAPIEGIQNGKYYNQTNKNHIN